MEQLPTDDMTVSMSQARLGVGAVKGTLASAWVLAMDDTVPLFPSDVLEHQDFHWASHFFLTSSSCSFCH